MKNNILNVYPSTKVNDGKTEKVMSTLEIFTSDFIDNLMVKVKMSKFYDSLLIFGTKIIDFQLTCKQCKKTSWLINKVYYREAARP